MIGMTIEAAEEMLNAAKKHRMDPEQHHGISMVWEHPVHNLVGLAHMRGITVFDAEGNGLLFRSAHHLARLVCCEAAA